MIKSNEKQVQKSDKKQKKKDNNSSKGTEFLELLKECDDYLYQSQS